jgi:hypothetical protein
MGYIASRLRVVLNLRIVHRMMKRMKLSFYGGDCGSKKCKQSYYDTCYGVWVLKSAVGFVLAHV